MSFLFGGQQEQQKGPDPVFAAKTEMEMYTGSLQHRKERTKEVHRSF